jgi:hypothetical protein
MAKKLTGDDENKFVFPSIIWHKYMGVRYQDIVDDLFGQVLDLIRV